MIKIIIQGFFWHFYDMPKAIMKGWKNFLYFNFNFFSVFNLLKSYFSPWRKYHSSYGELFEVWKNIETFVFNGMSRIIGAILRTFLIVIGIVIEIFIFFFGLIVIFVWLLLPILIISGLIFGVILL